MSERVMGSKVAATEGLYGAELNKVMAKAINAKLPAGLRVTLRSHGGKGLTATIKGCADIWNPERLRIEARAEAGDAEAVKETRDYYWFNKHHPRHAPEAELLLAFVERELQAYNWDGSDIQTDYFDVRFYLTVEFNRTEQAAQRIAIIDAASPLRSERRGKLHAAWAVACDWLSDNGFKPMAAWQAGEVRTMRAGLLKAFGREFVEKLDAEIAEIDAKLATADDWAAPAPAKAAA